MPLDSLLLHHWWLGAAVMALVAVTDYALTLWGARLFRRVSHRLAIDGSYETVPMFQNDIDSGRMVSVRFIAVLTILVALLAVPAKFGPALGIDSQVYLLLVGFLVLIEVPIHLRHASNIVRFLLLQNPNAANGRIVYSRWYVLRAGSVDFFSFAVLFLLAYAATVSYFFFGGAIRCAIFGIFQLLLSFKAARKRTSV